MTTIRAFTTIEQSRKLAEILPLESADMYWKNGVSDKYIQCFTPFVTNDYRSNVDYDYDVPAWSLAALLGVLPGAITNNDGIAFELNIKKNIIEYSNPSLYLIYKSVKADNTIDACAAMIEELNKLNLL